LDAYGFAAHVGLVLFSNSDSINYACPLTPLLEVFREVVDDASMKGDTALYDALDVGRQHLMTWHKKHPKAKMRLLCLSDGKDTCSKLQAWRVAQQLQECNIVLDAISIGDEHDSRLKAIAKSSGGYFFKPTSLAMALQLNELETMLSQCDRQVTGRPRVSSDYSLSFFEGFEMDRFDPMENKIPERKQVPELKDKVVSLEKAVGGVKSEPSSSACVGASRSEPQPQATAAAAAETKRPVAARLPKLDTRDRQKRVMQEMQLLLTTPHPEFDVYVSDSNIFFWRVVVTGPDSTPYKDGCWCFYVRFGEKYPQLAPEIRFVVPIRHININSYGLVCHSILGRNYTMETTMKNIFDAIYSLLLNPGHCGCVCIFCC